MRIRVSHIDISDCPQMTCAAMDSRDLCPSHSSILLEIIFSLCYMLQVVHKIVALSSCAYKYIVLISMQTKCAECSMGYEYMFAISVVYSAINQLVAINHHLHPVCLNLLSTPCVFASMHATKILASATIPL